MATIWDEFELVQTPAPAAQQSGERIDWDQFELVDAKAAPKQNTGLAGDLATDIKRGVQKLPGVLTGLADIPVAAVTGERYVSRAADALGEATGFQPGKWAEAAANEYSPRRKAGAEAIERAWQGGGAADIAGAYLSNPGNIAGLVAESLPSMVAGGLVGRAALAGAARLAPSAAAAPLAPVIAGAGGEGAMIAGQSMANIGEDVDARRAAAASAGAGLVGAGLGVGGGMLARRLGVIDPETAIAGGVAAAGRAPMGLTRRLAGGATAEGLFEEMPQSVAEQAAQNWAEQNPIGEGVARAAVEGGIAGGLMGAGANVMPAGRAQQTQPPAIDPNTGPLSRAASLAQANQAAMTERQRIVDEEAGTGSIASDPHAAWSSEQARRAQEQAAAVAAERVRAAEQAAQQDAAETEIAGATGVEAQAENLDFNRFVGEQASELETLRTRAADSDGLERAGVRTDMRTARDQLIAEGAFEADQRAQQREQFNADAVPFERILPQDYDTLNPIRAGEGEVLDRERAPTRALPSPDRAESLQAPEPREAIEFRPRPNEPLRATPEGDVGTRQQFDEMADLRATRREQMRRAREQARFVSTDAEARAARTVPYTEQTAQREAERLSNARQEPFTVVPHPVREGRFAAVPARSIAKGPQDAAEPAQRVAPRGQEGERTFAPETGTLGIPRAEMPQVPSRSHGGLVKHLNAQGIAHETTKLDAASLKPTQAEYSPEKVEAAKTAAGDRAVIVSSDGHIVDGHHQAMAAAEEGKQVKAIVLDAPIDQALEAVKASPSAQADSQSTAPPSFSVFYNDENDVKWGIPYAMRNGQQPKDIKPEFRGDWVRLSGAAWTGNRELMPAEQQAMSERLQPGEWVDVAQSAAAATKDDTQTAEGGNGATGDQAARQPEAFVSAPDGSIDFGEITPEMAQAMRRQAGKIRLQNGVQNANGTGWGLAHIEARHGREIRSAGFESVAAFISDAVSHVDAVWKPGATSQVVAVQAGNKGKVVFLELQPSHDEKGDFYRVNSAFPAPDNYVERKQRKEGWRRLWSRYPVSADASGASGFADQSPDAGETAPTVSPQSKASVAPASQKAKAQEIADFGEKIGGARKDMWAGFQERLSEVSDDDIANQPLSKSWPQPDYRALIDAGVDPWAAAFIRAARDEIPAKPRQSWKLKRWSDQVRELRSLAQSVMADESLKGRARELFEKNQALAPVRGRVDLYMAVGHGKSLGGVRFGHRHYTLYKGRENVSIWVVEQATKATAFSNWPRELATGDTKEDALAAFKAKYDSLNINEPAARQVSFDIYSKHGVDGYFIGKKIGRNHFDLAGPFKTVKEAREHKATQHEALLDRLEKVKEIPRERRDTNEPRVGEDMRNGQDVTPEMFSDAFGFRGVEFGNWVEQGRRQKDLNDAYDALMDMAAVLGIPPKAVSLNGELGLAFGARGSGGKGAAAAHYEPGKVVINLTKKEGAGSLGHEWWHALDNYFSRMRNSGGYMTDALDVSLADRGSDFVANTKVRREMIEAFGEVMRAIRSTALKARSQKLDERRTKEYWTTKPEMSARAFESYLISRLQDHGASNDYLANIVSEKTWQAAEAMGFELDSSYPYPTAGEIPRIRAAFDSFFTTIQSKETNKGVMLFSRGEGGVGLTRDAIRQSIVDRFPRLAKSIDAMLKRGDEGKRGGVVVVERAEDLAGTFASKTGRTIDEARNALQMSVSPDGERQVMSAADVGADVVVQEKPPVGLLESGARGANANYDQPTPPFAGGDKSIVQKAPDIKRSNNGDIQGFFDPKSGLTFMVAPNLTAETAPGVLLHEATHGKQRAEVDRKAMKLIENRSTRAKPLRDFLGRVSQRMEDAGESGNSAEAASYVVEQAVTEGRQAGFSAVDGKLLNWVDMKLGKPVGDIVRGFVAMIRAWALRNGFSFTPTVDDLVAIAQANVRAMARGDVAASAAGADGGFSVAPKTDSKAFRDWFGKSKIRRADGSPIVVMHGSPARFDAFDNSKLAGASTHTSAGLGHFFTRSHATAERYADGGTIYRGYLRMERPYTMPLEEAQSFESAEDSAKRRQELKRQGYDGVAMLDDQGKLWALVAFEPTQFKTTDNIGTFSPDDPRMRFSRMARSPSTIAAAWQAPEPSKMDNLIYTLQNKQVDLKRVVDAVKAQVGEIDDQWNPYLQEELFHGRSAKGVRDFLAHEMRPLLAEMRRNGVAMEELEKFLHARHAPEANAHIAKINPNEPELQDGGSGMTNKEAADHLASIAPDRRRALDGLAKQVDAINANTRKLMVESGLETADTIKAWEAAYKNYVPLQREDVEEGGLGIGQGYSVRGSAAKRRTGSKKAVIDILANIALQRERTIVRAEKNRVAQANYALAIKAPNPGFWMPVNPDEAKAFTPAQQAKMVSELTAMGLDPADAQNFVKEPVQRYVDQRTGLVAERINPVLRGADNVLSLRIDGRDRYVFFNRKDDRAQRMVHALKNLDADQLGHVFGAMAKVTRFFAAVNTQWNPIFGVVNLTRDTQAALLQLSTTPIRGSEKAVLKNVLPAMRGIYAALRAERDGRALPNSHWAKAFDEFRNEGGQTGYRDMFSNSQERADALERELNPEGWMDSPLGKVFTANGALRVPMAKAQQAAGGLFNWLSDYNDTLENAVRLSAYMEAKAKGLSNAQAASIAKNLTVNFNRKGQIATQAGAMYAFFNAAMQGTTRMLQTLKGPAGRKVILGGLTLGALQAVTLAAAGFDDDEPPEFVRERSIVVPLGDGKYASIPMPLGFHVIPSTSRILTEWALSGFRDTTKRFGDFAALFADTFNPIGNAGWSMQTLAPTALDPLAALSENRDWTGKPIAQEDFNSLRPTPGFSRAKDTASEISKALAYWINLASGGTDYKPGIFSPTPDQIDYLIGQVTGGVGREYLKTEQTAMSLWTGEELPPHKIPLLGRFYGDTTGQSSEATRFYNNLREINLHRAEIEGRRKDGGDVQGYLRDNPAARIGMAGPIQVEGQVRKLREAKRIAVEQGDTARVRVIDEQITMAMRRFNERVSAAAQ